MISAEVVPFLILAIGVDNMFLVARAERKVPSYVTEIDMRLALALQEIGPSIFVAAFCEALAFFIGMQTNIPALQSFCLVAGLGVLTDVFFQVFFFLPALYFDKLRVDDGRYDMLCCIKADNPKPARADAIRKLYNTYFVPFVFRQSTKALTVGITLALVVIGGMSCHQLKRGLNQNVSLVFGSDIYDYFETLYIYGEAGPPGYVVFNNVNYTMQENLDQMELIDAQLSALDNTIQSPIYSWVGPFKNYVNYGTW